MTAAEDNRAKRGNVSPGWAVLSVIALAATACTGTEPSPAAQGAPPVDWAFAVLESPYDDFTGEPSGNVSLVDDEGAVLWSFETDGLENGRISSGDEALFFADSENDYVLHPGKVPEEFPRQATSGADVIQDAQVWDAKSGTGIALFNNGFTETELGYTFMATELDSEGPSGDGLIDGYVDAIWNCAGARTGLLLDESSEPSDQTPILVTQLDGEGSGSPGRSVGDLDGRVEFPSTDVAPCAGEQGIVLATSYEPMNEEAVDPVVAVDLVFLSSDKSTTKPVSGWEELPPGSGAMTPYAAGISSDEYFWVDTGGVLRSVPLDGGAMSEAVDLPLSDDERSNFFPQFDEGMLTVFAEGADDLHVFHLDPTDPDSLQDFRLPFTPDPDRYISDIVIRDL